MNERDPNPMPRLDEETIAALIDGRLDADECARVLERLAQSNEDYEAYVEAVALLGELGDADASATDRASEHAPAAAIDLTAVRRRRARLYRRLAAAAGIAALLTTTWLVTRGGGSAYPPGVLVATIDPAATQLPGWNQPPWRTVRAGETLVAERQLAFRLGVRMVLLEAAEIAADSAATRSAARDVAALMAQLRGGSAYEALYREIETLDQNDERRAQLRRTGWEAASEAVPQAELQLGAWAGAARLALMTGDVAWFDHAAVEQRAAIDPAELTSDARAAWEAVLRALTQRDADRTESLRSSVDALYRVAG